MISMSAQQLAKICQGRLKGQDISFTGVSKDTRDLKENQLYVAIKGEQFDGHGFVDQARQSGAVLALVEKECESKIPQIIVDDSIQALGLMASYWRDQFTLPVAAITGSNGKTTTKEMTASIFKQVGNTLVTQGNLNNHIGAPLTACGLSTDHDFAVIEMGANHPGEIGYLSKLLHPTIALLNNAAAAHIEGFGSVQGVAETKGEIFLGLPEQGVGILNADDDFYQYWQSLLTDKKTISFALQNDADLRANWAACDEGSQIEISGLLDMQVLLPYHGGHNVSNALAATAIALAAGVDKNHIKQGLQTLQAVAGRLQFLRGGKGETLVNDAYNANPASFSAAIDLLAKRKGKCILVVGDMYELGQDAEKYHAAVGEEAKAKGVDRLLAVGEFARCVVDGFGSAGKQFSSKEDLVSELRKVVDGDTTVLVKGSRGMRMEQVVEAMLGQK